jgi:hypothetical protein
MKAESKVADLGLNDDETARLVAAYKALHRAPPSVASPASSESPRRRRRLGAARILFESMR